MNYGTKTNEIASDKHDRLSNSDFATKDHLTLYKDFKRALFADFRDLSISVSKKAKFGPSMNLLGANFSRDRILSVISKSLSYLLHDDQCLDDMPGEIFSYSFGIESSLKLYELKRSGGFDPNLIDFICASQVALMWRGCTDSAFEISQFAGALAALDESEKNGNKPYSLPGFDADVIKFKILFHLRDFLKSKKAPTMKALRESLGLQLDASILSRKIKGMKVRYFIPDEPRSRGNGRKPKEGTTYDLIFDHPELPAPPKLPCSKEFDLAETLQLPAIDTLSNLDPCMIDCDIRVLKERLGFFYDIFLLRFEMKELESCQDLRAFEANLESMGLKLIRQQ